MRGKVQSEPARPHLVKLLTTTTSLARLQNCTGNWVARRTTRFAVAATSHTALDSDPMR